MSLKTSIGWCHLTWNPVWGCNTGCQYCYARRIARRFWKQMYDRELEHLDVDQYPQAKADLKAFRPHFLTHRYNIPFPKRPARIFVNSMSDIYWWKRSWMEMVLERISRFPQHAFLFLTKFPEVYHQYKFPLNCWLGVTVEDQEKAEERVSILLDVPAVVRFVSIEPMLGAVDLGFNLRLCPSCGGHGMISRIGYPASGCGAGVHDITCPSCGGTGKGINWVILGAQTGPGSTHPRREWIQNIVDQCRSAGVPLFMKENLRPYWDGKLIQEFPQKRKKEKEGNRNGKCRI